MRRPPAFRSARPLTAVLVLGMLAGSACRSTMPAKVSSLTETVEPAAPAAESVSPDRPLDGRLEAGAKRGYLLRVPSDYYVRVEIEQRGVDLTLSVLDPTGQETAWTAGPGGNWGPESVSWISRQGGDYRLLLSAADDETHAGNFRIDVADLRPARPTDTARLAADAAFALARGLAENGDPSDWPAAKTALACARHSFRELADVRRLAEVQDTAIVLAPRSDEVFDGELAVALWEATSDLEQLLLARITLADLEYRRLERPDRPATADARQQILAELRYAAGLGERIGSPRVRAYALDRLGYLYTRLEQGARALGPLSEAAELRRESGDVPGEFFTRLGLGAVQRTLGEPYRALHSYERATELAEHHHYSDPHTRSTLLLNHAYLLSRLGDLDAAQRKYEQALTISRGVGDRRTEFQIHQHLGNLYTQIGQPSQAGEEYRQALLLADDGDPAVSYDEAYALLLMGWHLLHQGEVPESMQHFRTAMDFFSQRQASHPTYKRLLGNLQMGLGSAAYTLGDLDHAVVALDEAATLFHDALATSGEIDAHLKLAQIQVDLGNQQDARLALETSLSGAMRIEDREREGQVRVQLARLDLKSGDASAALTELQQAIDIRESLRSNLSVPGQRESFFANWRQDYELLISVLAGMSREPGDAWARRAFQASERAHGRTLLEILTESRIDLRAGVPPELRERETQAERRLSFLHNRLAELRTSTGRESAEIGALKSSLEAARAERDEIERRIWRSYPRYADLRNPRIPSVEALQAALPPGTAFLEYALGDERSFLFAVTRSSFASYTLPAISSLRPSVRRVRQELSGAIPDPRRQRLLESDLAYLYRVLVQPAEEQIAAADKLVIVPDRDLFYVPFEALRVATAPAAGAEDYLISRWAVGYAPSASVLLELSNRGPKQDRRLELLAFADPFGGNSPQESTPDAGLRKTGENRAPLPGARSEVRKLQDLFGESQARILLGASASETVLKQPHGLDGVRFLHFASHGIIDVERPAYSHLVLAPDPATQEDGLLYLFEILDLHLDADLVVLSACETALGREVRGEGLIGLARSFLYAGAPKVVVSLWPVSDASTPELMLNLYSKLIGGLDTLEALRLAKLELMRGGTYRHPRYWAPFVVIGAL